MPRVAKHKGADPRMPMLERKLARLIERIDNFEDAKAAIELLRDRLDQAEQTIDRLRQRVTVVENKLP